MITPAPNCGFGLLRGPGALLVILFCFSLFFGGSRAALVNRTIDDVFGDLDTLRRPVFLPTTAGVWKDQTCSDCAIRPDTNRAVHHTYTSATYNPQLGSVNVSMDFNGTAIYIFFILANDAGDGITSITNCTFKLDGQIVGTFQHVPDLGTTDIEFNALAFSKTDIPFGEHRIVAATEGLNFNAYINFDYAIYTFDDLPVSLSTTTPQAHSSSAPFLPQATTSSAPPQGKGSKASTAGAIAGGVIGGSACLAIIGILCWACLHRKRKVSRINLLGPTDDVSYSKGRGGLSAFRTNRPAARTGSTIHTFAATGTPFPSAQPLTSEPSAPSRTEEIQNPRYSTQASRSRTTRPGTSFRVINPGPDSPARDRVNSMRQAGLKKQLVAMREELEYLKANLKSTTGAAQLQEQSLLYPPSTSYYGQTAGRNHEVDSASELRKQIQALEEEVENLRAHRSTSQAQGLANESPPDYTTGANNLSDIPFFPDRKRR